MPRGVAQRLNSASQIWRPLPGGVEDAQKFHSVLTDVGRTRKHHLLDLPLVYGDVLTDGFGSNERAAAALRLGQTVNASPQLRLQPQRHYPLFRHEYPPNTKEHCVFKLGSATGSPDMACDIFDSIAYYNHVDYTRCRAQTAAIGTNASGHGAHRGSSDRKDLYPSAAVS